MSKLRDFIEINRIRQSDFAASIGATQGMVSRLINGAARPSLKLATRIERATRGEVPANSWDAADGDAMNLFPASPTPEESAA